MKNTDVTKDMTPEEIKAQKKRDWQREYRRLFPERVRAQRKAWRENNPEKNRESQKKSRKKYYLAHQEEIKERSREWARKYYAAHRDEILARQKIYRENKRKELAEKRKIEKKLKAQRSKKWCVENQDKVREIRRRYLEKWKTEELKQQKRSDQNPQSGHEYTAAYNARTIVVRDVAAHVCPVFRFMLELKETQKWLYNLYGGKNDTFVRCAIKRCLALAAMDASLCPMVAKPTIKRNKMVAACTMSKVFKISNAWDSVLAQAMLLRQQNEK